MINNFNNYFSYLSYGSYFENPIWVEPYKDTFGAGIVTTVSIGVYDHSKIPRELIAVIGNDHPFDKFLKLDSYKNILDTFSKKIGKCLGERLDRCFLEILRGFFKY